MTGRRGILPSTLAAVALFGVLFALRVHLPEEREPILVLMVVPVALLAAEYGLAGGVAAAAFASALVAAWIGLGGAMSHYGALARACTFVLVGVMVGRHVDRRRRLERQNARHFELSLDLVCTAGLDGYFKRVSPAFTAALGYSTAELLSRPFLDLVHPDDRERTKAEAARLFEAMTPTVDFRNRYLAKDGSVCGGSTGRRRSPRTRGSSTPPRGTSPTA
jgi:PAS domain S-box-containing protein